MTATAQRALERIKKRMEAVQSRTVISALGELRCVLEWDRVLEVYHQVWPEKFDAERAKMHFWDLVKSFFEELEQHGVPVYTPDFAELSNQFNDWAEFGAQHIPLQQSLNKYDSSYDYADAWEDMAARCLWDFGWREPSEEGWGKLEGVLGRELPDLSQMPKEINHKKFRNRIRKMAGGESFLYAYAVVNSSTGNELIDTSQELFDNGYSMLEWSEEIIRELLRMGMDARRILNRAYRVIDGYNQNPKRLGKLIDQAAAILKTSGKVERKNARKE